MSTLVNPALLSVVPIVFGLMLILVARYRRHSGAARASWLRLLRFGRFTLAATVAWLGWAYLVVSAEEGFEFAVERDLPGVFTFVPLIFHDGRECAAMERELCLFRMDEALPGHQARCLTDPRDMQGTFAEVLRDSRFTIPADAFILKGEVTYSPASGACVLKLARVTREMVSEGHVLTGRWRCGFADVCR